MTNMIYTGYKNKYPKNVYNNSMIPENSDILGMEESNKKKGLSEFRFTLGEMPLLPTMELSEIKKKERSEERRVGKECRL